MNLVADQAGQAPNVDPDLLNPWGMAISDSNFWIANNMSGKVSIVDREGRAVVLTQTSTGAQVKIDLGIGITGAASSKSSTAFVMHDTNGCAAAKMLFSNLKGQILAVNADVNATAGVVVVDRSSVGASYTGLAIIDLSLGQPQASHGSGSGTTGLSGLRILAPDFANGRIDVFDENFNLISETNPSTGSGSGSGSGSGTALQMFVNPNLAQGYAPFNVVQIADKIYVTYAERTQAGGQGSGSGSGSGSAAQPGQQFGAGLGMVDEFDVQGNFLRTIVATQGLLNAPWGVALAPADFCTTTSNKLLIGNHGDGHIIAVEPDSGRVLGMLADSNGNTLVIDGLWSLLFEDQNAVSTGSGSGSGSGSGASTAARLYFSAGPNAGAHGLFGYLMSTDQSSQQPH